MKKDIALAEARWNENKQYWQINIQRDGCRKSFYSKTAGKAGKKEAEAKAQTWIDLRAEGDPTLRQAVEAYLEAKEPILTSSTIHNQRATLNRLLTPEMEHRHLSRITVTNWQQIINNLAKNGLKRKTIETTIGLIVTLTHYCQKSRWPIVGLTAADLDIPKTIVSIRKDIIQPEHIRVLFSPSDDWYINAYRLAVILGLRRGELAGLQWNDIQRGHLIISRSLSKDRTISGGKTKNAARDIVLPDQAKTVLLDQHDKLEKAGKSTIWVFPVRTSLEPSSANLYDCWRKYCRKHNFPQNVDFHSLRRTMISLCKTDMPLELLKSIVGHSASMDTIGIYGREVNGEAERTAALLDGTFRKVLNG